MSVDLGYLDPDMSTMHTVKLADGTYRLSFRARCPAYWYRATARHQAGLVNLTEVFADVGPQAVPHLGEDTADIQEEDRSIEEEIVRVLDPHAPQFIPRRTLMQERPDVPPKQSTIEETQAGTSSTVVEKSPVKPPVKSRKRKYPRV